MATCTGDQYVENIERTECIGNSLVKINNNFKNLDIAVCELENKSLSTIDSSTIDLTYDPSTNTLSADFKPEVSSFSKIYDAYFVRPTAVTWIAAANGSPPKNWAYSYSWPGNGYAVQEISTLLIPMSSDSFFIKDNSAVFLTHNIYCNYDGGTGLIAYSQSYDYSTDNGTSWTRSLSANSTSIKVLRQYPAFGDPFDNGGASGTGTSLLTAAAGTTLKVRPTFQLMSGPLISVTNFIIYGSHTITIQKL